MNKILLLPRISKSVIKIFKSDFVKVSSWSAASTIIKMITGFVSIKIVSKIIGPTGIAMVGQLMNGVSLISAVSTGCINQGVTKYISENYDDEAAQRRIISNAVLITIIATLMTTILVILFNQPLTFLIFKSYSYSYIIILFAASIGLYSFNFLFVSILNGFKKYKKYIAVNVVSNVAALLLSIYLVVNYSLIGALLNCILSQSIIIIICFFFIKNENWFRHIFSRIEVDRNILKKLSGFTAMALTSSIAIPAAQFYIRNTLINNVSLESAGIWEGVNRISNMYLSVITASIAVFYLPRLSELRDQKQIKREIINTVKIVLPVLAICCFCIYFIRDYIILIVFTKEFLQMRSLIGIQMIGDFFKIASWLIAFLFWAKAMTKAFILFEIVSNLFLVCSSIYFINNFGLVGSVYGYALTYFFYLVANFLLFRRIFYNK